MTKQQALIPERNEELSKIKSIDDYVDYLKKHNRHTLKISLLNEQTDEEEWVGKSITFCNEDNALSHLDLLVTFYDLIMQEENRGWGYKHTSQELVERIINPIKAKLEGK
tara:strand:+ start:1346 stop:1675 length:330 start_codon:yes stop_codon:yes gene_type:complete